MSRYNVNTLGAVELSEDQVAALRKAGVNVVDELSHDVQQANAELLGRKDKMDRNPFTEPLGVEGSASAYDKVVVARRNFQSVEDHMAGAQDRVDKLREDRAKDLADQGREDEAAREKANAENKGTPENESDASALARASAESHRG